MISRLTVAEGQVGVGRHWNGDTGRALRTPGDGWGPTEVASGPTVVEVWEGALGALDGDPWGHSRALGDTLGH